MATNTGAVPESVAMIQTLMIDWINATPGDAAKEVWNRIEEKLVALASPASPAAPMGFNLVPVDPTEEMRDMFRRHYGYPAQDFSGAWAALLSIAPAAPAQSHLTSNAAESNDRQMDAPEQSGEPVAWRVEQRAGRYTFVEHVENLKLYAGANIVPLFRAFHSVDGNLNTVLDRLESMVTWEPRSLTDAAAIDRLEHVNRLLYELLNPHPASSAPQPSQPAQSADPVGHFLFDGERWAQVDGPFKNDADVVALYRAQSAVQDEQFGIDDCIEALVDAKTLAEKLIARNQLDLAINRKIDAAIPEQSAVVLGDERAAFEAWFQQKMQSGRALPKADMWDAWQAATASAASGSLTDAQILELWAGSYPTREDILSFARAARAAFPQATATQPAQTGEKS